MDIKNVLMSGDVERFHAVPGITKQKLSEHQWGVSILVQHLYPNCRKEVVLTALTHDVPELVTGDIPATFKWSYPEVREFITKFENKIEKDWDIHFNLSSSEYDMLKICDMLEGMVYCIKRFKCGELNAATPFLEWAKVIDAKWELTPSGLHFYKALLNQMSNLGVHHGRK